MTADGTYTRVVLTVSPDAINATLLLSTKPVDDVAIDSPEAAGGQPRVWVSDGDIVTDAASVTVYTLQGLLVGAGKSVSVTPGIYVAVADGGVACKIAAGR